ncbi:MAG: hypothetical protein LC620_08750 [Halobacteriales archaeon]|nr:hypothetical protein [Halobacteriales archaeon]
MLKLLHLGGGEAGLGGDGLDVGAGELLDARDAGGLELVLLGGADALESLEVHGFALCEDVGGTSTWFLVHFGI